MRVVLCVGLIVASWHPNLSVLMMLRMCVVETQQWGCIRRRCGREPETVWVQNVWGAGSRQVYLLTSRLRKHRLLTSLRFWYRYSTPGVVVIQSGLGPSGIVCECAVHQLGTEGEQTSWGVSCTLPPEDMWKLPPICSYALWCGAWTQEWWTHIVRRSCR